jgi:GTP-binding protein EngB required for normal cell division/uncharacterized Fe-S cluster-containing radical SAM superfamily protein
MKASVGLDETKRRANKVSASIRDIARLIDDKAEPAVEVELKTGGKIIPGLNMHHDAESLYKRAGSIDEGLFTILVLGMFKNGKSTLLNAMLGTKALPARAIPTTGVITLLVHGDSDVIQVYEFDKKEPRKLTHKEFFEEYQLKAEDAGELQEFRFQNVRYARMETSHRICARGVRLVDSPGLGEHLSRTNITESFLKEADALIFVLDATKQLGIEERDFLIKHIGQNRLEQVFFVVNRINFIEDEDKEEVYEHVQKKLRKHFCDLNGRFDKDLYYKRVFWVNALGALMSRQASPPDDVAFENSGVKTFEDQLEAFLTKEQMLKARFDTTVQVIGKMLPQAFSYIYSQKITLGQPLEKLIERRDSVSKKLDDLAARCQDIQLVIAEASDKVQLKLEIDLINFVEDMIVHWEEKLPGLSEELSSDITFGDVALGGLSPDRRKKIEDSATKTIERYVKKGFENWSDNATEIIREDVDELDKKLTVRIKEFVLKLSEARKEFSGDETVYPKETQDITINITTSIFGGGVGLMGMVMGTIRRVALIFLVLSISYLTPLGWAILIGLLLYELVLIVRQPEKLKRELLNQLGRRLHENLRNDLRLDDITSANFIKFVDFLKLLKLHKSSLDQFIWKNLSDETKSNINKFKPGDNVEESKKGIEIADKLSADLTRITRMQSVIYNEKRFTGISLPDETKRLLETNPTGKELALLNRHLLVDAYPDYLAPKLRDLIQRSVKSEFVKVSDNLTTDLYAQINQLRSQMDATVEDMKKEQFSAEQEQVRLDQVDDKLLELYNEIRQASGFSTVTRDELAAS